MKKYWSIIALFCVIKLAVHLIGNQNYGFQRDELLHLSVSEHLDWGYMEFPPFIAWVGKISHAVFGYSLEGTRLFPTLAGVAILILCCAMAIEFGGGKRSIIISGLCVLCFLPFFRNHTLFQPVAFDQLFFTLAFYFLIRFIKYRDPKELIFLAVVIGFGILNKYTFLLWALAFVVAMIFHDKARVFSSVWLYVAGAIAIVMVLPNILWQYHHHFPILLHFQRLKEVQLEKLSPFEFGLVQLRFPITLLISICGMVAMFRDERLKQFRSVGVTALTIFVLMWLMKSKPYYFFATYPVLFAAGAVALEPLFEKRKWVMVATVILLLITSVPFIPDLAPVLPIESYVKYTHKKPNADGRIELTGDYADMFGWTEQVRLVDSVYRSLTDDDRTKCILWAENYGEAGAIKVLGDQYDLPDPVSVNGSFWLWGPGETEGSVAISIGNEEESVQRVFAEYRLVKIIRHKYAVDEENGIPLYVCRKPLIDLKAKWPDLEKYVFD